MISRNSTSEKERSPPIFNNVRLYVSYVQKTTTGDKDLEGQPSLSLTKSRQSRIYPRDQGAYSITTDVRTRCHYGRATYTLTTWGDHQLCLWWTGDASPDTRQRWMKANETKGYTVIVPIDTQSAGRPALSLLDQLACYHRSRRETILYPFQIKMLN